MLPPKSNLPPGLTSADQTVTLRVLDANANRALEGLRVVEDYARLVLEDRGLTERLKQLRHDLAQTLGHLDPVQRLAARETAGDVGTQVSTDTESLRSDPADVAAASLKRMEQALRCLEEYGKLVSSEFANRVEGLRYRAYTLARAVTLTPDRRGRLRAVRTCLLIDGRESVESLLEFVATLIDAGVDMIQLRDKRLDDRTLLERARRLRELTAEKSALLILNDRADIAVAAQADGVHLGQDDLPIRDARRLVGPRMLIGRSTHSLDQVRQAVAEGACYLGCGPTFPSTTKSFDDYPGLEFLREAAAETTLPAFAIGGITPVNLDQVLATGFRRVATSSGILGGSDPLAAAVRFARRLRQADQG